jgi:hypothetical protein
MIVRTELELGDLIPAYSAQIAGSVRNRFE